MPFFCILILKKCESLLVGKMLVDGPVRQLTHQPVLAQLLHMLPAQSHVAGVTNQLQCHVASNPETCYQHFI
jgi:hypothetical protein